MFKEIFSHIDMQRLGETGMLLFFIVFIAVALHAITRRRKELDYWASLPLAVTETTEEEERKMSSSNDHDPLLSDHAYDGIQEYDNPMPGWWKWIFAGTVAFAGLYFTFVSVSGGVLSPISDYDRAVVAEMKKSGVLKPDAATLLRLSKDPDMLKTGAAIFATNCIACHSKDGQGLIGPNLTDDFYINVEKIEDIPDVITKGRKNGAMPAWGNRLNPNEVVMVASYVASLRGKNLPGKAHEGKQIPPWQ